MEASGGEGYRCYCGDLDPATSAHELQQLFSRVAPCTVSLRRVGDDIDGSSGGAGGGSGGLPTSHAYIAFASAADTARAIAQLDGHRHRGQSLRVMHCLPASELGGPHGGTADASSGASQDMSPAIQAFQLQACAPAFGPEVADPVAGDGAGSLSSTRDCVMASGEAAIHAAAPCQACCQLAPAVPPAAAGLQAQARHEQRLRGSPVRRKSTPKPAIVIRGLAVDSGAEELLAVFRAAGVIKRVRLVTNEEGRSAGVAFITYTDQAGMCAALELGAGLAIGGRPVDVSPAHRDLALDADSCQLAQHAQQQPLPAAAGPQRAQHPAQRQQQARQAAGTVAAGSTAFHTPSHTPPLCDRLALPHQPAADESQHWQATLSMYCGPQRDQQRPQPYGSFSPSRRGGSGGSSGGGLLARAASGCAARPARPYASGPLSAYGSCPLPGGFPSVPAPPAGEVSTDTLFARPLAPDVDEQALSQLFASHAPGLVSVKILRHPDCTSRGCGFVRFAGPAPAAAALQALDGNATLAGRAVRLSWAKHKQPGPNRANSSGGGGGGGWDWGSTCAFDGSSSGGMSRRGSCSAIGEAYYDPHNHQQQGSHPAAYQDGTPTTAMLAAAAAAHGGEGAPPSPPTMSMVPVLTVDAGGFPAATWMPCYYPSGGAYIQPSMHSVQGMPCVTAPPVYAGSPVRMPGAMRGVGPHGTPDGSGDGGGMHSWEGQQQWQAQWRAQQQQQEQQQQQATEGRGWPAGAVWYGPQYQQRQLEGSYQRHSPAKQHPGSSGDRQWRAGGQSAGTAGDAMQGRSPARPPHAQRQLLQTPQMPPPPPAGSAAGGKEAPAHVTGEPVFYWHPAAGTAAGGAAAAGPAAVVVHYSEAGLGSSSSGSRSCSRGAASSNAGCMMVVAAPPLGAGACAAATSAPLEPAGDGQQGEGVCSPTPDYVSDAAVGPSCSSAGSSRAASLCGEQQQRAHQHQLQQQQQQQLAAGDEGADGSVHASSEAHSSPRAASAAAQAAAGALQGLRLA